MKVSGQVHALLALILGMETPCLFNMRLVGPERRAELFWVGEKFLPTVEIRTLDLQARSPVSIPTTVSWIHDKLSVTKAV